MWNFFGGNKNKGNIPPPTNLQAQKTKQIETLNKLNASQAIRDVEYRVTFQSQSSNISLIITLPPQFPQDPPTVKVSPAVYHPWVNQDMRVVGCAGLNNFYMHSNLGDVIQSIIEEFSQHSPTIVQQQYGSEHPPYQGTSLSSIYPPYSQSTQAKPGQMPMPDISSQTEMKTVVGQSENEEPDSTYLDCNVPDVMTCFPELKEKSCTELNELLNDEDTLMKLVQNLPDFMKLLEENEKLSNQCIHLAKENLTKRPVIENLKHAIIEKNQLIEKIKNEFEQDQERHMTLSDQFHPTNIQTNLQVAVMEAEEESENLFENFLEKKIDLDEFMQVFLHKRTLCHSRRAKEEKLSQIIHTHRY